MIPRQWYIRLNSLNTVDYPYMEIPVDLPYLSTFSQDTESNILNVMIVNNGELMKFPDYVYVLFTIDKPDATQWIQAGEVVRDGHVRVGLNYQALSALGVANVTVKVYTDTEIVTMPSFQIKILADPLAGTDGAIASTSEYPILSGLIQAVQNAGENEQSRIDAELLRDSAETARIGSESQRVVAETARADAEIIRIANENTRIANENNRNVYEAWNSATTYAVGNKVVKDGSSYLAINASTNISPPNASYWLLIASKGDKGDTGLQGEQGIQGEQGMQGPQGVSIVSVIRTSGNGAAGTLDTYTITYSDATTSTFQVYNGADGLGAGDMLKSVYDTDGDGKVNSAVNADTVNGKTVAENVPSGAVFTDDQTASEVPYSNTTSGMTATTVQDAIDEINAAHNTHLTNNMPHQFSNIETSKTYKFGFQVSSTGKPQIIYEEVV
jgi:hypothetical protein